MYNLKAIMTRLTVMQQEALAATLSPRSLDAVAYFPYQQDVFPYMANRILRMTIETDEEAEDIELDRYTISMRLVIGHLTEGYKGEVADRLYDYIPLILEYFDTHQLLDTTTLGKLDFVHPLGAQIVDLTNGAFQNSGIGATQVGVDFTLDLPLLRNVY